MIGKQMKIEQQTYEIIIGYYHLKENNLTEYECVSDESIPFEPPELFYGYVWLCNDSKKPHILYVKDKNLVCYHDTVDEKLFITYDDMEEGGYVLDKYTLRRLTEYLNWDDYRIYNYYFNYEENVLCIEKK